MRIKPITFLMLALIITSCGEYEKLLKSTDNELKRQKVFDYYDDGKYTKSIELLPDTGLPIRLNSSAGSMPRHISGFVTI